MIMKKFTALLLLSTLCFSAYCQFDAMGFTLGMQYSKSWVKSAYFEYNTDNTGPEYVTAEYDDRFNFVHFDCRLYSAGEGMYVMADASAIPDLLYYLTLLIIGKKDLNITGKLRKIDENFNENSSGYGSDWSYIQFSLAGGNGFYIGADFDFGTSGVHTMENTGAQYVQRTGEVYFGGGGMCAINTEIFRSTFRVDKLWNGHAQPGLGIVFEGDYCIKDNFFAGFFYRYRKFGALDKDDGSYVPKNNINTFGLRAGLWLSG